jgi:hypothetical protein
LLRFATTLILSIGLQALCVVLPVAAADDPMVVEDGATQGAVAEQTPIALAEPDSTLATPIAPILQESPSEQRPNTWIDRTHDSLHSFLWRSAMNVDRWFGADVSEDVYAENTRGSITPIVLWDEFNGFSQKFRFRVRMPLPHLDERYNAFIGTFSRDEFVTEREQESGAIPRQRSGGTIEQDQTLLGIQYREREGGARFEADAGIRIRSPIDPFVKAGYRWEHTTENHFVFTFRELGFWQNSEGFGFTSRIDVERALDIDSLIRWTASGTISQETEGVRGYTALTWYRALPRQHAIAAQVFTTGEFDAAVPLEEYGLRVAYRKRIFRDWLVLELRPSVTWPRERRDQPREASWGLGIGIEMFFGEEGFHARPATL